MPSYRSTHKLDRIADNIKNIYGATVNLGKKYIAICGYVGFSESGFTEDAHKVTCLRCRGKMHAHPKA